MGNNINSLENKVLKQTRSVCPDCLLELEAFIIRIKDKIILRRECARHGEISTVISNDPDEFEDLFNYYNELKLVHKQKRGKKNYTIFYTNRCNLNCPICLANANFKGNLPDPTNESLKKVLKNIKRAKINIFGGEPTIREDLPEFINLIRESRNTSSLFTNGIKISDYGYLKTLRDAGLNEVHLQFDGFNKEADLKFRNIDLLETKLRALENAKILKMPVILEVTLDRVLTVREIPRLLEYALANWHVRGICFRSYSMLGKRAVAVEKLTMEELTLEVERSSQGRINRKHIFILQKLAYLMAEWCCFDWCFSHRYMLIYRKKDKNYLSLGEILNFDRIEYHLKRYLSIRRKNIILAKLYFIFIILPKMIDMKRISIFLHLLKIIIVSRYCKALTQSSLGDSFLVIDFEFPCDRFTFELDRVCNTNMITEDLNFYSSFYEAILEKERFFQKAQ